MSVPRRRFLWTVGVGVMGAAHVQAATASGLARELRRMVGFQILAADDVRQSWQQDGTRYIQLRQSGLFRQVGLAIGVDPPGFTDAVVFVRPAPREYRLLIDGEFYQVAVVQEGR